LERRILGWHRPESFVEENSEENANGFDCTPTDLTLAEMDLATYGQHVLLSYNMLGTISKPVLGVQPTPCDEESHAFWQGGDFISHVVPLGAQVSSRTFEDLPKLAKAIYARICASTIRFQGLRLRASVDAISTKVKATTRRISDLT